MRASAKVDAPRMRVLVATPSTNQMYSGVGRALQELARRMTARVAYEFAIDDANGRNLEILLAFANRNGLPVHVGRHTHDPRYVEPMNLALPALLARETFDVVELVGFANGGVGRTVLEGLRGATLAYTPHDQPLWTVPMNEAQRENVARTHHDVIARADVVFADSPHERRELQAIDPGRSHVEFHPLGCDFDTFGAGTVDRPSRLLFVGDLNEIRKRFDRVARVVERLLPEHPGLRLVVVGNKSESLGAEIGGSIRQALEFRGYVDESELRRLYRESAGLLLFSEVEAFGLPILEAMASGTPVYLSRLATTSSLFGDFRSARFCDPDDVEATAALIGRDLRRRGDSIREALAERPALRERFDWNRLAASKSDALSAAWWRRNRWSWSA